ncbi:patatin-like phospholipase family protein [Nitrospira sp. Nam74]
MSARSRLALALSGGGFTGYLFEIGALAALDDIFEDGFNVNHFDFYVGVSAGSAAAALIANGVTPEEILRANLVRERPYYFERRDIFVPAMGEGFKSIPRAVRQFSQVARLYLSNRRDMGLVDLLETAQQSLPGGFYTLDPFARYLEATFASKGLSNAFGALRHPLYIPAIDLDTGQSVIFGEEEWREVPISKAITASSAAPVYFCPVRIGGREYIDAGIGRIPCFDLATQKAADLMVIIHPSSQTGLPSERMPDPNRDPVNARHRGFLSIADVASRINLEARLGLALDLYQREHPDKFFVITPCESLMFERSFLSFRDRIHLLRCGYLSVVQTIKKHITQIGPAFARHGISISVAKIEERLKTRTEQLSGMPPAPSHTLASSPVRAGWSSTF